MNINNIDILSLPYTISFDFCQFSLWIEKIKNRSEFKFWYWLLFNRSFLILICSQSPTIWLFLLRWTLFSCSSGLGLESFRVGSLERWTYQNSIDIVAYKVHFVVSSYIEQIRRLLVVAVLLDLSAWISVAG